MPDPNLTLGDVLPDDLKSDYDDEVLNVTMSEAINIAVYDEPPSSDLSKDDIEDINEIYDLYQKKGATQDPGGSAYWNKSEEDNKAYWSKES